MNWFNHFGYDVRSLAATNSLKVCAMLIYILGTLESKKSSLKFSIYKNIIFDGFRF